MAVSLAPRQNEAMASKIMQMAAICLSVGWLRASRREPHSTTPQNVRQPLLVEHFHDHDDGDLKRDHGQHEEHHKHALLQGQVRVLPVRKRVQHHQHHLPKKGAESRGQPACAVLTTMSASIKMSCPCSNTVHAQGLSL